MNNYFLELTKDELKAIITALEIARHDYPDTAATNEQEESLITKTTDLLATNPDDSLHSIWYVDDVMQCNSETDENGNDIPRCTIEQARQILDSIDRNHDATIGINWDVIEYHLNELEDTQS